MTHSAILAAAGLTPADLSGGTLAVRSPIDGAELALVWRSAKPLLSRWAAVLAFTQCQAKALCFIVTFRLLTAINLLFDNWPEYGKRQPQVQNTVAVSPDNPGG